MKAVIFDCDGVLVDSEEIVTQVWLDMMKTRGIELDKDEFLDKTVGGTIHTTMDLLSEYIEIPDRIAFEKEFRALSMERFTKEIQPVQGVETLIQSLNCPMAIGSNGPKIKIMHNLKLTGLGKYFNEENIFSGHDIGFKPKPDLYRTCANSVNVAPENCIVIEDSFNGVGGAIAAKIDYMFYDPHMRENRLPKEKRFDTMEAIQRKLEALGFCN